ncbi:unnamed protein product [Caretta caretta]
MKEVFVEDIRPVMLLAVKYELVIRKSFCSLLNTGFHIIRAEYNFVFPSGV